jgi:predicted dithiol-disulfide oxidoreductase (DUF899 family)
MRVTRLVDESQEYTSKREELRSVEIESRKLRERVAEVRRRLPQGPAVKDYMFLAGPADLDSGDKPTRTVYLSELFTGPNRSLIIYHMMYGKRQTTPCPMCTMWIDGYNGVAQHIAQNIDFAVVAAAELPALRAHARHRGWRNLRLLSAGEGTFKYDLCSEDKEGNQDSTMSVFTKDANGTLRHFYSVHPGMGEGIKERGIDLMTPVYNLMDLTPQGRDNWYAKLDYAKDLKELYPVNLR